MIECDACGKKVAFNELVSVGVIYLYCADCMDRTGRNESVEEDSEEDSIEEEEDEE